MKMRIIFLFVSNPASQMPKSVFVLNCLINTHLRTAGFLYGLFSYAIFMMTTDLPATDTEPDTSGREASSG